METSLLLILAPVIGLVVNVLCQWQLLRLTHGEHMSVSVIGGFVAGLVVTLALTVSGESIYPVSITLVNLMTIIALSFGYFTFLNMNITSLRIRLLRQMLATPGKRMADAELRAQYGEAEMVERRLARLSAAKQIELVNGRWVLKPTPLLVLNDMLAMLRQIIIPARR